MAGLDAILDKQHRDSLDRAIQNVLSTQLALDTWAQIIDGLPLASVACDQSSPRLALGHPILYHTSLCHGASDAAQDVSSEFADIGILDFDAKVRGLI